MELFKDQQECVLALQGKYAKGYKAPVLVAPCGFGKTVLFSYIAKKVVEKNNSVIICTHRQELLNQTCNTLDKFNVSHETITSGKSNVKHSVIVASIPTLVKRLNETEEPTLLIFDECHHILSTTWKKIVSHFGKSKLLGVTATPWRMNGEGLGQIFDCMVLAPTAAELMECGRLAKPVYYAPPQVVEFEDMRIIGGDYSKTEISSVMNKPHVTGDAIMHYKKICPDASAVAFCATVKHAEDVATEFKNAGIAAESIDGLDNLRASKIKDFAAGKIKVLTSCELISEGFDLPAVSAAIMLRPTASLAVWVQQAGRALRVAPGKDKAIILDHVGNSLRHGFIEHITEWSLEGIKRKQKDKEAMPLCRRCEKCFLVFPVGKRQCPECGGQPVLSRKELKKIQGELQKMEAAQKKLNTANERKQAKTLEELIALGRMRNYKSPYAWAQHILNGRSRKSESKM